MTKITNGAHLQAPYFFMKAGLSLISLGELLQAVRDFGPGKYYVINGKNEPFFIDLFDNGHWEFSTPQFDMFEEQPGHAAAAKRERQNVASRDSLNPHPRDE